ncbi:MAG TPA: IS630 family transposase [Candidatus Acidoferrum sp.]|nr:IS630 family transposase [Candidatus Acidoferrum sp.]
MPRPYSDDLRWRAIESVEEGASRHEAAERFEVSPSTVINWLRRWRDHGNAAAMPSGGSVSRLEQHAEWFLSLVARQPDLTLDEVVAAKAKRRIGGSRSAVSRFYIRHNITFKKSLRATEQDRVDVARARRLWIRRQGLLDPARLVFIDETAATTKMVRLRGRCPRGVRLIGHAPHGHWKTITFVAGLRNNEMVAPLVVDGPMDGPTFVTYVEQCLAPTLDHHDVVIMDNLSAHKVPGVREAIETAGAKLRYLPQYSPDLNPIEMSFSKVKELLRKAAERTVEGLCRRIGLIIPSFTPQECANYFTHAGYG